MKAVAGELGLTARRHPSEADRQSRREGHGISHLREAFTAEDAVVAQRDLTHAMFPCRPSSASLVMGLSSPALQDMTVISLASSATRSGARSAPATSRPITHRPKRDDAEPHKTAFAARGALEFVAVTRLRPRGAQSDDVGRRLAFRADSDRLLDNTGRFLRRAQRMP